MRRIDADALKEFINNGRVCDICPNKKLNCAIYCDFPDSLTPLLEKVIDNAPTIDDLSEYSDKLWQKAYERGKAERPTEVNCSHCDYFKFSQSFIENIVKLMTDYNIESVEDLMRELNHINELLGGRE